MKINHNMSAMIANKQLIRNESNLTNSIERLSSGLKINHASDDAAGMAIATKMRAQIKGLDQASRNASDGTSVIETADGALQEVTNMLQRMRELSVQAANGTNGLDDREAIQAEIESLTQEIERISTDTEFNTKKLLDGSLDQRVFLDTRGIGRMDISDAVLCDKYEISVTQDARQAVMTGGLIDSSGRDIPAGEITINGVSVSVEEGQDLETVYENIRTAAEEGEINVFATGSLDHTAGEAVNAGYTPDTVAPGTYLVFVSDHYGSSAEMKITCDNPELADFLGINTEAVAKGTDAKISLDEGFTKQASYTSDGNDIVITDRNGFRMSFQIESAMANTEFTDAEFAAATPGQVLGAGAVTPAGGTKVGIDVTDIGPMTLQIGAGENQTMDVRIPSTSPKALYIDKVNVCTVTGAGRAIESYDKAIAKVSEVRSRMGAYQNRLEHAVFSLEGTEENMTAALSRIEDVDMAEEMTAYTQYTVLTQAATSVLAQANEIPQQALQLLQ